eukprot:48031-Pyramimonas_sp.AAC.1
MQFQLTGSLNLVVTDPTKPQSFEQRIDVSLPCAVLILGAQCSDPPTPTEACSEDSGEQRDVPDGGKQKAPHDEASSKVVRMSLGDSQFGHFDSGWRAQQALIEAEFAMAGGRLPLPADVGTGDEQARRSSQEFVPSALFAEAGLGAAEGISEESVPAASCTSAAGGASTSAMAGTPPAPSPQRRTPMADASPEDCVWIADSPRKAVAPNAGLLAPTESGRSPASDPN